MNEQYTIEELAYRCSDFGEHVDKIIEHINLGDVVTTSIEATNKGVDYSINTPIDLNSAFDELGAENAREMLSKLDGQNPVPAKFLSMIDEKTRELAMEAAHSYKGKYDE